MKQIGKDGKFILALDRGESLVKSITEFAAKNGIQGATISGVGALMDVELGYYVLEKKDYIRKTFHDDYELLALNGNISMRDGKPFVHVHTVLGDDKFGTIGGHLFEAKVAVTAEVSILPLDVAPAREMNESIGLALICKAY